MNRLERCIYDLVKRNAFIKECMVRCYQLPFSILGRLKLRVKTKLDYCVYENFFFGFHDKPSLDAEGRLLGHVPDGNPEGGMLSRAKIGWHQYAPNDPSCGSLNLLGSTQCCNFQQGSMLAFVGKIGVAYNDMAGTSPITRIVDFSANELERLPFHFFSVSGDGDRFARVSFARFGHGMPGYGYRVTYAPEVESDARCSEDEGEEGDFYIYSRSESKVLFRIGLAEARANSNIAGFLGYEYFSHACFSPSGERLFLLYRRSNIKVNYSQLIVVDLVKGETRFCCTDRMVSHLHWLSEGKIILYGCVDGIDDYYLYDVELDVFKQISFGLLTSDGHPHAHPFSGEKFVTDTYPNRERRQKLYSVDLGSGDVEELMDVYSPLRFRGVDRVDFHPRFSVCGKYVSVDTPHSGIRSQLVAKL
ncbi:hypothetical protein [Marinagarivorans algicola]|uniref:hypothetical protein n=1 Tax=Marinagarivorans algicola TaxID=1513270 RepID=UPI0006B9E418|nr:hypothetical protein [Marinagarivorans algicola]